MAVTASARRSVDGRPLTRGRSSSFQARGRRVQRVVMPRLAWPEELRQPPSRFLAAVRSAAAAHAQLLNLLDGITDLHLQNMFAE
jgi:hypothetical protein